MNGRKAKALRRALGVDVRAERGSSFGDVVEKMSISRETGELVHTRTAAPLSTPGPRGQYRAVKRLGAADLVLKGTK